MYEIASLAWSALKRITADNVQREEADLCAILGQGVVVTDVTVTVNAGAATTVTGAGMSAGRKRVHWFVNAGPAEESVATKLNVTTNDGQTWVFPVDYVISVPS